MSCQLCEFVEAKLIKIMSRITFHEDDSAVNQDFKQQKINKEICITRISSS